MEDKRGEEEYRKSDVRKMFHIRGMDIGFT